MARIMERQLEAYRDSVLDQSAEADKCRDLDELIGIGIHTARFVVNHITARRATAKQAEVEAWKTVCAALLKLMTTNCRDVKDMQAKQYVVERTEEFSAAMLSVRELWAALKSGSKTEAANLPSYAELSKQDKELPPVNPKWSDDDLTGLQGPCI